VLPRIRLLIMVQELPPKGLMCRGVCRDLGLIDVDAFDLEEKRGQVDVSQRSEMKRRR
jgi:hypothetical protein